MNSVWVRESPGAEGRRRRTETVEVDVSFPASDESEEVDAAADAVGES